MVGEVDRSIGAHDQVETGRALQSSGTQMDRLGPGGLQLETTKLARPSYGNEVTAPVRAEGVGRILRDSVEQPVDLR